MPRSGYYPDPSIPGYIRYWNGSAWVPGTSRPEPREGEPLPAPPSAAAASTAVAEGPPASQAEPAPMEETGPIFLDEDREWEAEQSSQSRSRFQAQSSSAGEPGTGPRDEQGHPHGNRSEPASVWQANASRQAGFAGQDGSRVSWGRAGGPAGRAPEGGPGGRTEEGWGESAQGDAAPSAPARPAAEGTFQMRALTPNQGKGQGQGQGQGPGGAGAQPDRTVGLWRSDVLKAKEGGGYPAAPVPPDRDQPPVPLPAQPQHGQGQAPPAQTPPAQAPPAQAPPAQTPPAQTPPAQRGPVAGGSHGQGAPVPSQGQPPQAQGGGQPAWAQQVHDLAAHSPAPGAPGGPAAEGPPAHGAGAMGGMGGLGGPGGPGAMGGGMGGPEAVTPWRPPVADPFAAAAQQARPADLGKRFAARLVDAVVTGAVAAAVVTPLANPAIDHIQQKMEAVRQAGETEQVWLIDGTTGGYLALALAAMLVFGLFYEVLPTQRWGRTLGKKLFGLRVLNLEQQESPAFVAAFVRWLVYGVLAVLVIGVVNVLWCVFDRPWRQCWHDKIARTFVTKDSDEIRL